MLVEHSKKFGLVITLPAILLLLVYAVYGHLMSQSLTIVSMQAICLGLVTSLVVIHIKLSRAMLVVAVISMTFFSSLLVLNTALLPLAHNRSAQGIVRALPASGALVGMYGDYATSADYYSGYVIPKLTETPEVRSNDSALSGKYTMPIQSFADFLQQRQQGQRVFVLMKNKEEANFTALAASVGFLKVDELDEVSLYELVP